MIEINCKICNKTRLTHASQNIKTCSRECRNKLQSISISGNNNPSKRDDVRNKISVSLTGKKKPHKGVSTKVLSKCKLCEKSRLIEPSRIKNGRGVFCSRLCYGNWMSVNKTGANNPLYSVKMSEETKDKIRQKRLKSGLTQLGKTWKIAKDKCKNMVRNNNWNAEKNPSWKGGVSIFTRKERQNIMSTKKYKDWRRSVLLRDGYSCVNCGDNSKLEVDHIRRFIDYPELRFDIDNGRTLCQPCHRQTATYGNRRLKLA